MAFNAVADEIYKSVDQYGNVTYSSQAPKSDQIIDVLQSTPEPTEEEIQAAEERLQILESELETFIEKKEERAERRNGDEVFDEDKEYPQQANPPSPALLFPVFTH